MEKAAQLVASAPFKFHVPDPTCMDHIIGKGLIVDIMSAVVYGFCAARLSRRSGLFNIIQICLVMCMLSFDITLAFIRPQLPYEALNCLRIGAVILTVVAFLRGRLEDVLPFVVFYYRLSGHGGYGIHLAAYD